MRFRSRADWRFSRGAAGVLKVEVVVAGVSEVVVIEDSEVVVMVGDQKWRL